MSIPIGIFTLGFMLNNSRSISEKIDSTLLKKTRTLSSDVIPAIIFSKENKEGTCKKFLKSKDIEIKYDLPLIGAYAVEIDSTKLEDMAKSDVIEYVSDDAEMTSLLNVATQVVGAREANKCGYTGRGVGIAVLDTGIYPHYDFTRPRNRIIAFKDFVNGRVRPYDDNGHGTFTAGVAAGNGYSSGGKYAGVAPEANIIAVKVMDEDGSGNSSDIIAGMQWVVDHRDEYRIKIMSLSLGAKASNSRIDPLAVAVKAVWGEGIVVVAAAGNSGPKQKTITTPGVCLDIITVGAVDDKRTIDYDDDVMAQFSSRGPTNDRKIKPDIVAPGVSITGPNTDKGYTGISSRLAALKEPYKALSGTSVATPIVAGAAALLFNKNPNLSPVEIKKALTKSTVKMRDVNENSQGKGILNIRAVKDI